MIYYFKPDTLPIAFNIIFSITLGYWIMKLINHDNVNDLDKIDLGSIKHKKIIEFFIEFWTNFNHCIPFLMFLLLTIYSHKRNAYDTDCIINENIFNTNTLMYSFLWIYSWVIFILIPWVYITNDVVYPIFSHKNPLYKKILLIIIMKLSIFISNIIGFYIFTFSAKAL